ncbi:hypothetical protein KM043_008254 [Ampulex compressa]|nr:hypothetical protein KM043_008254 [Ampulex compressa]
MRLRRTALKADTQHADSSSSTPVCAKPDEDKEGKPRKTGARALEKRKGTAPLAPGSIGADRSVHHRENDFASRRIDRDTQSRGRARNRCGTDRGQAVLRIERDCSKAELREGLVADILEIYDVKGAGKLDAEVGGGGGRRGVSPPTPLSSINFWKIARTHVGAFISCTPGKPRELCTCGFAPSSSAARFGPRPSIILATG